MLEWTKKRQKSHALSLRIPAAQWQCVEQVKAALAADPYLSAVDWTRTQVLTWLVWRGLASLKPDAIKRGEWDAQVPEALNNWLPVGGES